MNNPAHINLINHQVKCRTQTYMETNSKVITKAAYGLVLDGARPTESMVLTEYDIINHFPPKYGIFINISLNRNYCNLVKISPKFVSNSSINIKPALNQSIAWSQTGDKPDQ